MATLTFQSHELLQKARRQIDVLQISFDEHDQTKKVWLNAKKERSETRPARLVHRAFEAVQELEAVRADRCDVVKDLRGTRLLVGKERVGHTLRGEWEWAAAAKTRYGRMRFRAPPPSSRRDMYLPRRCGWSH